MRDYEYRLLDAIAENSTVTQAGLAAQLGVAVGSVNWYIKRMVAKGYVKATRMQRTRLKYHLTSDGVALLARRTSEYMERSLGVYRKLRRAARETATDIQRRGIQRVLLRGDGDAADILKLTLLEHGVVSTSVSADWAVSCVGSDYHLEPCAGEAERTLPAAR
ncbi:MAG: winged helix-turn-helix transcriptional regulator [Anaerolineales bacterium]|jgi:DNA-binding MarR family transcriptional regulator|nr:winged helix-turn-helix transcriptional regulator [Anaerolineales bacterium]